MAVAEGKGKGYLLHFTIFAKYNEVLCMAAL